MTQLTKVIQFCLFLAATTLTGPAYSWGERGHHLITRVAVQNLIERTDNNQACTRPFALKDHMLAHLSNVPDIVWRANYMSEQERALNSSTHYIDLEFLYESPKLISDIDTDFQAFTRAAEAKSFSTDKVGTAPWRVLQLHTAMVEQLKLAGSTSIKEQQTTAVGSALKFAGIMSHFVGDLANPHHTTTNHNGQLTGNTGLHAYFESDVVSILPLSLDQKVFKKSGARFLNRTILKPYARSERTAMLQDPQSLIFALLLNSHQQVDRLTKLDNRYSLLEKSPNEETKALRKPVEKTAKHFATFAVERLAIGASVLSELWYLAWLEAGQPDLSNYHSYDYPVRPEFILPDYSQ